MSFQRPIESVQTFINTGYRTGEPQPESESIEVRPLHLFEEADTLSIFEVGPTISVSAREADPLHLSMFLDAIHQHDDYLQARAWTIGNRMGLDMNGLPWPATVRSLSIGDVAAIRGTYYAVAMVGWTELGEPPLVNRAGWGEHAPSVRRFGDRDWRDR